MNCADNSRGLFEYLIQTLLTELINCGAKWTCQLNPDRSPEMIVRCVRIISENTGQLVTNSPWLSIGKLYRVLSLEIAPRYVILIRMIGDEPTPALFDFRQFEIVSENIPSNSVVHFGNTNLFVLGPAKWNVEGFWERYFDGEAEEQRIFDEEREIIEIEDSERS